MVERILDALGMHAALHVEGRHLGDRRRQREPVHARLNGFVAGQLARRGFLPALEVEVGAGPVRGWIDLMAYRPADRALIVEESKGDLPDVGAFQRSLAALESTPEVVLPSEAPFSEEEVPATPQEKPSTSVAPSADADVLPQVITADMLRARMAQRRQAELQNLADIEVPAELLAGYSADDADDFAVPGVKPKAKGKKGVPVKTTPAKPKKKKYYVADTGDVDEDL